MKASDDGAERKDSKSREFLERLADLGRPEGRRPLSDFLALSGESGEDDLRTVRAFLFDLYCQIYSIEPGSKEESSVRFKLLQELGSGESLAEVTNLFIGNLYLTECQNRVPSEPVADPDKAPPRGLAERAAQIIDAQFAERISLGSIAQLLSVSKEHLSRIFKKRFAVTVTERIHQTRIENAKGLIAEGELSLKQVCYETGYQSYNDFYRNFRKVTGISPKSFDERG